MAAKGDLLGVSDWVEITQDDVRDFGRLTRSSDPFHDDPAWAAAHSPYGGTVAHGFQILSLLTGFLADVRPWASRTSDDGRSIVNVNYGFEKIRFVAPTPVGARVRGRFVHIASEPKAGGQTLNRMACTVEIEGEDRPALIAEWLGLTIETPAPAGAEPTN